jgi:hypothetical protein
MNLSKRLRGQLSGSGGRSPGHHEGESTEVDHHREGFTPRSVSRRPVCGSPAPAKRKLRVSIAVTGLGEPHQELHPAGWSASTVHMDGGYVTFRSRRVQELAKNLWDQSPGTSWVGVSANT